MGESQPETADGCAAEEYIKVLGKIDLQKLRLAVVHSSEQVSNQLLGLIRGIGEVASDAETSWAINYGID